MRTGNPFCGREVCTGSSMVEALALGSELLWGLCASLVSGGVGGTSTTPVDASGEWVACCVDLPRSSPSSKSVRCIFFSTYNHVNVAKWLVARRTGLTEAICLPVMIFLAFSISGFNAARNSS